MLIFGVLPKSSAFPCLSVMSPTAWCTKAGVVWGEEETCKSFVEKYSPLSS